MASIEETWLGLEALVIPKDACDGQRFDMRCAFYAGCQATLSKFIAIAGVDDDLGIEQLTAWSEELVKFKDSLNTKPPATE